MSPNPIKPMVTLSTCHGCHTSPEAVHHQAVAMTVRRYQPVLSIPTNQHLSKNNSPKTTHQTWLYDTDPWPPAHYEPFALFKGLVVNTVA